MFHYHRDPAAVFREELQDLLGTVLGIRAHCEGHIIHAPAIASAGEVRLDGNYAVGMKEAGEPWGDVRWTGIQKVCLLREISHWG